MNPKEENLKTTAVTDTTVRNEVPTTAAATTTSSAHETVTTAATTTTTTAIAAPNVSAASARRTPEMRRSAVRSLIQRYFYQLQNGCGNPECKNVNCASSGKVTAMTPNDMAAKAIQLFSQDAPLCDSAASATTPTPTATPTNEMSGSPVAATSSKVPRTENGLNHESPTTSSASLSQGQDIDMVSPIDSSCSSSSTITSASSASTTTSSASTASSNSTPSLQSPNATHAQRDDASSEFSTVPMVKLVAVGTVPKTDLSNSTATATTPAWASTPVGTISVPMIQELVAECQQNGSYEHLVHVINEIFSSVERLWKNFQRSHSEVSNKSNPSIKLHELLAKSPGDLKKEDLRTLEGENDKDEDSTQQQQQQHQQRVALEQPQVQQRVQHRVPQRMQPNTSATDEILLEHFAAHIEGRQLRETLRLFDDDEDMTDVEDAPGTSADRRRITAAAITTAPGVDANSSETNVDLQTLRSVKNLIFILNNSDVIDAITGSVIQLAESIKYGRNHDWEKVLHCLVICFDIATNSLHTPADLEYLERALPKMCHAAAVLPVNAQARLSRIWAAHCNDKLQTLVQCCQQIITLQVLLDEDNVRENVDIIAVTKVLKIIFYGNIIAGQLESPSSLVPLNGRVKPKVEPFDIEDDSEGARGGAPLPVEEEDDLFYYSGMSRPHMPKFAEDKLELALHVSSIDCRVPLVPFDDFYNEQLSDTIQMHHDYLSYKNLSLERDPRGEESYFTFMLYAFVLTPATKVIALYYDSRMRMYSERNSTLYSILNNFGDNSDVSSRPDLKLTVRRDNLIDDALIGLELVAMSNPKDLKKQLVVEFMGEQGIDEGGVSKEFFQLIVEEIFNPDFGMFVQQEDTNTMWFNSTPFENGAQFTLIGIILGLAIYNNVILAVNFPMVVYRKLMGCRGTFYDLMDWNPTLYRSLKALLDYEGADMEETFMQTFKISYTNVFGEVEEHELITNGGNVAVGQHNKQSFVDEYSDFLLNQSVEQQFKAFKKGFEMVTDESPLKLLFRPEEIELLVCGSRKFDFVELEKSTEYEGGYSVKSQIIKDFWSVVHSMPDISKRKLLEFTTGSDRIPVGGLSRLRLLITRHGPDSDRLPTSHTCFNVLLLPEYSSKEKLEERLLKAINYSKGFGML